MSIKPGQLQLVDLVPGVGDNLVERGLKIVADTQRNALPPRIADENECRGCGWDKPCLAKGVW